MLRRVGLRISRCAARAASSFKGKKNIKKSSDNQNLIIIKNNYNNYFFINIKNGFKTDSSVGFDR